VSLGSAAVWFVPLVNVTRPANPVSVEVGDDPTSPVIVVAPVLVIPEPARSAKISALLRSIWGGAAKTSLVRNATKAIYP